MLGALPHQSRDQNSVSLTTLQLGHRQEDWALLIGCSNLKLQYERMKSKEATAVWGCILVMGAEHGRGHGVPGGSRDRDAPISMLQRWWDQACEQTSVDLGMFMAAEPLAPFSNSARHSVSHE